LWAFDFRGRWIRIWLDKRDGKAENLCISVHIETADLADLVMETCLLAVDMD